MRRQLQCFFFFFNDTATTEIYTLSLHDALPISGDWSAREMPIAMDAECGMRSAELQNRLPAPDRKSTRLNSSHSQISYAVFCLKKKKQNRLFATMVLHSVLESAGIAHARQACTR